MFMIKELSKLSWPELNSSGHCRGTSKYTVITLQVHYLYQLSVLIDGRLLAD